MPDSPEQIIEKLSERFSDDEQVAVLLATLSAALAETEAKLSIAELKLGMISESTALSLQRLGATLSKLENDVKASDEALANLHKQVADKLAVAAELEGEAQTAMVEVLASYQTFNGNLSQLKEGVAGLTKAAISSVLPAGVLPLIDARIDQVLGLSGGSPPSPNGPDGE